MMQNDDRQARNAGEVLFQVLAVRWAIAAASSHWRAYHDRTLHLSVVHPIEFSRVVEELIETQREEVAKHDLHHRALSGQAQSIAYAHDGRLADRRIENPLGKRIGETFSDFEG